LFQPAVKLKVPTLVPRLAADLLVDLHGAEVLAVGVERDDGAVAERLAPAVYQISILRLLAAFRKNSKLAASETLGVGEQVVAAVVAGGRGGRGPVGGRGDLGERGVVVALVAVDDDLGGVAGRSAGRQGGSAGRAGRIGLVGRRGRRVHRVGRDVAAVALDLAEVGGPRPVGAGVDAVVGLELAVADDVVLVAGDAVALGDVAGQLGGLLDEVGVPGVLVGEAGVLDADGEVVAGDALEVGLLAAVEVLVVLGGDVVGALGLLDELGDLGAVLLDDVVGADAGLRVDEPAPAAGVGALAGVDDDHPDLAGVAGGAGALVGRVAVEGAGVVGVGGEVGPPGGS
jgi:hypothetical protein